MRWLIFLLAVTSCYYWEQPDGNHYHLYIAPGFTDAQYGAIIEAYQSWESSTNGIVTFDLNAWSPNDPDTISIFPNAPVGPNALGETWNEGKSSRIDMRALDFRQTILHEAGHSIGLAHNPDLGNPALNGVMCAERSCASTKIECVDVRQFCKLWHYDPQNMPPCQG